MLVVMYMKVVAVHNRGDDRDAESRAERMGIGGQKIPVHSTDFVMVAGNLAYRDVVAPGAGLVLVDVLIT